MKEEIIYNDSEKCFEVHMKIPHKMTGVHSLDENIKWEEDAVCIYINENMEEYGLFHTQYLDYKDSLQATQAIVFFNSKEEALDFGTKYNLMIEYSYN